MPLRARDLETGTSADVAKVWMQRVKAAPQVAKARDLYGGRAFGEAKRAAQEAGGRLAIVSAGLGLVDGDAEVPAYGLTTARRDPDCILDKTGQSSSAWWAALCDRTPLPNTLLQQETGLILAALSSTYVTMVATDWASWPAERQSRLRLFTKEEPQTLPDELRLSWMPYDDRLDAVGADLAGTQGDFAQRALRHFATTIGGSTILAADKAAVRQALDGHVARDVPLRARSSDADVCHAIHSHWDVVGGRSGAMLRHLRDHLGMACEQGRFATLFRQVSLKRTEGTLS